MTVTMAAAVVLSVLCFLVLFADDPAERRFLALTPCEASPTQPRSVPLYRSPIAMTAVVALATFAIVPWPWGVIAAPAAALVARIAVSRLESAADRQRRSAIRAALPMALDLMAACFAAGASPASAAATVGQAVHGPLGTELVYVAERIRLGAAPEDAWLVLEVDPQLRRVVRSLARSAASGSAAAEALTRLAAELRAQERRHAEAAARRIAVRAAAPLGLCFLPAFVLLGIVPAVIGALAPLAG